MRYNTDDHEQAKQAFEYLTKLTGKHARVEVKEIKPGRSLKQNAYYHMLLGIFGLEFGWTIEEAKILHKRNVSQNIFVYEKNGVKFVRSSISLDTKEMTTAIDQFKKYSAENGLVLPDADDTDKIDFYNNLIEREGHNL